MSRVKNIFDSFFWTLIVTIINAVYGFISVPILLVHFGKENFGLIGVALSINVYLKLLDMGFSLGNVKFFSEYLAKEDSRKLRSLFQASLLFYIIIGLVNILVLVGISVYSEEIFSLSFSQDSVFKRLVLILIVTTLGEWISSVMSQFLRANDLIGWQQRFLLLSKLVQMAILLLTIYLNFSIVTFFLLTTLFALLPLPFYANKIKSLKLNISFFPKYDKKIFKEVLPYSLSIFSFGIFQFSANYLRPLILGIKVGLESVADYRVMEGFAGIIVALSGSFLSIVLPIATKVKTLENRDKELRIAYEGTKYISIFLAFIVFGFLLVSDDLIVLYVGENYSNLIIWLNIWILTLLGTHNSGLSGLVLSNNSLRPIVYISAASTIISLVAAWFLASEFKIGGVVIGYTIYVCSQLLFYYFYYYPVVMKYDSAKIFFQSFFKPTFFVLICFGFIYSLKSFFLFENKYLKIIILEIIFTILAISVTYFVSLNTEERNFIKGLVLSKKKKGTT